MNGDSLKSIDEINYISRRILKADIQLIISKYIESNTIGKQNRKLIFSINGISVVIRFKPLKKKKNNKMIMDYIIGSQFDNLMVFRFRSPMHVLLN